MTKTFGFLCFLPILCTLSSPCNNVNNCMKPIKFRLHFVFLMFFFFLMIWISLHFCIDYHLFGKPHKMVMILPYWFCTLTYLLLQDWTGIEQSAFWRASGSYCVHWASPLSDGPLVAEKLESWDMLVITQWFDFFL